MSRGTRLGLVAAVALLGAAGCKDKARRWDADQWAGLPTKPLVAGWQGTWVMPFRSSRSGETGRSTIGTHEIWTVAGSRLVRYDGVRTQTREMHLIGPCVAAFTFTRPATRDRPTRRGIVYEAFAFRDGHLYVGNAFGYRRQGTTVACLSAAGPQVITHRGGRCHLWVYPIVHQPGHMVREKVTCRYVTRGGRRLFEARGAKLFGRKVRFRLQGDLLQPDGPAPSPARRFPSPEAAKRVLQRRPPPRRPTPRRRARPPG